MKYLAYLFLSFFILFILSCNGILEKDKEKSLDNTQAGNTQAGNTQDTGTMKPGKLTAGLYDSKSGGYVKNEVIVKFVNGTDQKTISAIQKKLHLEILRIFSSPNLFLMKITDNTPVKDIQKSLNKYKEVQYAEPNYTISIDRSKGEKP